MSKIVTGPCVDDTINFPYDSEEYVRRKVTRDCITIYHPTSTCKMGADDDRMAVLNPKLQVRGIRNLRIVDCSSMPDIPAGNTNLPAVMVGLKGADIVTDDARRI